jgi:hypothetical protein
MTRLTLLMVILTNSAVGAPKGNAVNSNTSAEQSNCRLDVEVLQSTNDQVKLRYTFSNRGTQNVYLFHRLYEKLDDKKVFQTSVNKVYVEFDGSRAIVSKKIFPVPRDIDVEKTNVPCASVVKPNDKITETLELKLPLVPQNPYPGKKSPGLAAVDVEMYFELGFVALPPDGEKLGVKVETLDGPATYFGSFQPNKQSLLRVGPLPGKFAARPPK